MRRDRRASFVTVGVVMVLGLVAGCGDDSGDRLPPPSSPEPTASSTPTLDPDEAEVRAVLDAYLRAATAAKVESDLSADGLAELTTPSFLDVVRSSINRDIFFNRRYEGTIEMVWAEVVERNSDDLGPQLVVDVCLDGSNFVPVDIDTGELNGDDPREHPSRHVVRHLFRTDDDGDWVVDSVNLPSWFIGEREEVREEC